MYKKSTTYNFFKILWIFIIGCFVGYVLEVCFNLIRTHNFETRQGLIYGPFAPVYGIGMLAFYLILPRLKKMSHVFLVSSVLGGVTEYLCSYFQQRWFGTVSWDYSNLFLNINGRTSFSFCVTWGILGIVFIKFLYPFIEKAFDKINYKLTAKVVTALATVFMIFNISISSLAAQRQHERRKSVVAKNEIDMFLDEHYPDEFMNKVFVNKIDR